METKELLEKVVIHSAYGSGIIKGFEDNHMKVDFPNVHKVSIFVYPECFIKYLAFGNKDLQAEMQRYLEEWKISSGYAEHEAIREKNEATQKAIIARREAAEKVAEDKRRLAAQRSRAMQSKSGFGFKKKEK